MKKLILAVIVTLFISSINTSMVIASEDNEASNFKEIFSKGNIKGLYRAIYFTRNYEDGPDSGKTKDREVFANGGAVHLSTAPYSGLSGHLGFYTVQDFNLNDEDKNSETRILFHTDGKYVTSHENTESFSVLGEYYLQGKWGKTTARLGATEMWGKWRTPWLHSWPFRVIPANFEGLFIQDNSFKDLKVYLAPYIWGFRENNKKDFISPKEQLTRGEDEGGGISFLELTYTGFKDLKVQGGYQYYYDVYDHKMLSFDYTPKLSDDLRLIVKGRLVDQADVGDSLLGEHEAFAYGAGLGLKAYGFTLEGRYQATSDDGDLKEFFPGVAASYTANLVTGPSLKADLESHGLEANYDFGYLSPKLKGLSLAVTYTEHDYPEEGLLAEADMSELQFDTNYKFSGSLKGLSTRFRLTFFDQDEAQGGVGDVTQFRSYLEYKF